MGNARENAAGDFQGLLSAIIGSDTSQVSPYNTLSAFYTNPGLLGSNQQPGLANLQNYLQGNYMRDLGQAGRSAGAQASAYGGTNPYAFIQHAQSGVGDRYANLFAGLPMEAFKAQLAAKGQNFEHLARLLALKGGAIGQRSGGFGGALESAGPSILSSALRFPTGG